MSAPYTLQEVADELGISYEQARRWFLGQPGVRSEEWL